MPAGGRGSGRAAGRWRDPRRERAGVHRLRFRHGAWRRTLDTSDTTLRFTLANSGSWSERSISTASTPASAGRPSWRRRASSSATRSSRNRPTGWRWLISAYRRSTSWSRSVRDGLRRRMTGSVRSGSLNCILVLDLNSKLQVGAPRTQPRLPLEARALSPRHPHFEGLPPTG